MKWVKTFKCTDWVIKKFLNIIYNIVTIVNLVLYS